MISSVDMNTSYGSTTGPYYISKYLVESGCEILHICTKPQERREKGVKHLQKRYYKNRFWVVRTTRDIFRMYKECKSFAPDVLYVHQLSNAMRALPFKYLLKVPFVFDGISEEKIELIKNGVDTNTLRPAEPDVKIRRRLGIFDDDKVIMFTCPRGFFASDIALKYFFK